MLKKTTRGMTAAMTRRGVGFAVAGGGPSYDTDAQAYITLVEAADSQSLETGVKDAINAFVVGCKSDGIWDAIKAACIMAGARTLAGALVPLVGTAPTNNNFVSGDYNRKTGLVGNGATKYLDSNFNVSSVSQNNVHLAVNCSSAISTFIRTMIGCEASGVYTILQPQTTTSTFFTANDNAFSPASTTNPSGAFFCGCSRSSSTGLDYRFDGTQSTIVRASNGTINANAFVFARNTAGANRFFADRMSFYSIGESLNLALLDSRVSTLMTAIGAAIP